MTVTISSHFLKQLFIPADLLWFLDVTKRIKMSKDIRDVPVRGEPTWTPDTCLCEWHGARPAGSAPTPPPGLWAEGHSTRGSEHISSVPAAPEPWSPSTDPFPRGNFRYLKKVKVLRLICKDPLVLQGAGSARREGHGAPCPRGKASSDLAVSWGAVNAVWLQDTLSCCTAALPVLGTSLQLLLSSHEEGPRTNANTAFHSWESHSPEWQRLPWTGQVTSSLVHSEEK